MKKLIFSAGICLAAIQALPQTGSNVKTNGNVLNPDDKIGSTNNEDVNFITNNQNHLILKKNGNLRLVSFDNGLDGLVMNTSNGVFAKTSFTGNTNDVLNGMGVFTPLSGLTGWTLSGAKLHTNKRVGINVANPDKDLEVDGDALVSGTLYVGNLESIDVVNAKKRLDFKTTMSMTGYDATEGTRNEIWVNIDQFYLNSKSDFNNNTIINSDNSGMVGIGTSTPSAKLEVKGDFKVSGESYYAEKAHFSRITAMPSDSLIHFGDSSLVVNTVSHRIYANPYFIATTSPFGTTYAYVGGIGIGGSGSGTGITKGNAEYSLAMGYGAFTGAKKSIAIGNFVSTTGPMSGSDYNNIVIGSGASFSQKLINNKPNTLMIGFNSTEPTFFVNAASGPGTTGSVGIATTYVPDNYKLAVNGKIIAEELQIKLRADWPDYVFGESYNMMSLTELEAYIKMNKHLPHVPDAEEVKQSGIATGEMLKIQMEKIEELTKYIIEQDKKIERLQDEVLKLKTDK